MEGFLPHEFIQNKKRRTMLLFLLTGVATFFLGKLIGDKEGYFLPGTAGEVKETKFKNFIITEDKNEMKLSDNSGNDIFIIDKASFKQ